MKIGSFDTSKKVLVVAEIGNNHEGSFANAEKMVRLAAESGVDAVKFQTFKTDYFVSDRDSARFERLKSFELSYEQFERLSTLAKSLGLLFLSTPLDLKSADFLSGIVDAFKIASSDNNFYPLLKRVAETGLPVIVSTGLVDLEQIRKTEAFLRDVWKERGFDGQLGFLHCVTSYPVPPEEANLLSVPFLAHELDCTIGYSDHTSTLDASLIAVALGARIVEKHFTLDKNFSAFRDHQLSADPADMKELVRRIRQAEVMFGRPDKGLKRCEAGNLPLVRRSIVAGRELPAGHRLIDEDLTWIRPGDGLPPGEEGRLIGKTLKERVPFGRTIKLEDVL